VKTPKETRPTLVEARLLRRKLEIARAKAEKWDALVSLLADEIRSIAEDAAEGAVDDVRLMGT
jgi:hypothetical protein